MTNLGFDGAYCHYVAIQPKNNLRQIMPLLIRLTYASTTTSSPGTLREDLTNILEEARIFNFNHRIHGALIYGNNCFYQCIEGDKAAVDHLYQKILNDPRHKHVQQLSYDNIATRSFDNWSMKYVLLNDEIKQFFPDHGIAQFNPYKLDQHLKTKFLGLLLKTHESVAGQHEKVNRFAFGMHGRTANLKYVILVITIAIIVLCLMYWTMMHLPVSYQVAPSLGF